MTGGLIVCKSEVRCQSAYALKLCQVVEPYISRLQCLELFCSVSDVPLFLCSKSIIEKVLWESTSCCASPAEPLNVLQIHTTAYWYKLLNQQFFLPHSVECTIGRQGGNEEEGGSQRIRHIWLLFYRRTSWSYRRGHQGAKTRHPPWTSRGPCIHPSSYLRSIVLVDDFVRLDFKPRTRCSGHRGGTSCLVKAQFTASQTSTRRVFSVPPSTLRRVNPGLPTCRLMLCSVLYPQRLCF